MKSILIIGGMGPQASDHVSRRLTSILKEQNKHAEVVHIKVDVEEFYDKAPRFVISRGSRRLLWDN